MMVAYIKRIVWKQMVKELDQALNRFWEEQIWSRRERPASYPIRLRDELLNCKSMEGPLSTREWWLMLQEADA